MAGDGRLHLEGVGAEVGEGPRSEWTGDQLPEFQDLEALQGGSLHVFHFVQVSWHLPGCVHSRVGQPALAFR